jgi:hypothetical protein
MIDALESAVRLRLVGQIDPLPEDMGGLGGNEHD